MLAKVHLIATGGTIAAADGGLLDAAAIVARSPELSALAEVTHEDMAAIPSSEVTLEMQLELAQRINRAAGVTPGRSVVITHGTDSLEETAFLVDLFLDCEVPVVFTGSMRTALEESSDVERNLVDAFRVASSSEMGGLGAVVVMDGVIHSAREVLKRDASALDAFVSPGLGPLGQVADGRVVIERRIGPRLRLAIGEIEPAVDLVTLTAGSGDRPIRAAMAAGARAIVVELFGLGNLPASALRAVADARVAGIIVAFSTRTRSGRVELREQAAAMGVISARSLDGLKARMLLVVSLPSTRDPGELQERFDRLTDLGAVV